MFITSFLLILSSILPLGDREEIDQARLIAYDYLDNDHYDSAHWVMDLAIDASKRRGYDYGRAKSIFVKSYLYRVNNKLGESFELNLKALKILENCNDPRTPNTLAQLYGNTGEILIRHFKYREAIKYFEKGLEISINNQLDNRTQNLLYNRGFAYKKDLEFDKAKQDFESSLKIARNIGDEWMIVNSQNMLGEVAIDFQKFTVARGHFQILLNHSYSEESENKYKGLAYANIGRTFYLEDKIQLAQDAYSKSLFHNDLIDDPSQLFQAQLALVELNLSVNNLKQAEYYGNQADSNYDEILLTPDNYRLFNLLTSVAFAQNNYDKAENYHQKYVEENEAFIQSQKETLELSEQYKMELLTASFFKDIEKQEQMAQLNQIIYLLIGLGLLSLVFVRAKKYLLKKSLEQAFREVTQRKNLHI